MIVMDPIFAIPDHNQAVARMRALFVALLFAATHASAQPEAPTHGSRGRAGSSSCTSGCVFSSHSRASALHTTSALTRRLGQINTAVPARRLPRNATLASPSKTARCRCRRGCHPDGHTASMQCTSAEGCDPPSHAVAAQAEGGFDASGYLLESRAASFWQYNDDGLPRLRDVVLHQGRVFAVMNLKLADRNGFTLPGYPTDAPPWHLAAWQFSFEGVAAPITAVTFGADANHRHQHNHTLIVYALAPPELLQEASALRRVSIEGVLPGSPPLRFVSAPFCVGPEPVAPLYELAACTQINRSAVHLLP